MQILSLKDCEKISGGVSSSIVTQCDVATKVAGAALVSMLVATSALIIGYYFTKEYQG